MYYSTVQLLRERRVVGAALHSLIIPCWVMERTVCSRLNKSCRNVFQSHGQNNDLAFVRRGAWATYVIFIMLIVNLQKEEKKKKRHLNEKMAAMTGDQLDIKIITQAFFSGARRMKFFFFFFWEVDFQRPFVECKIILKSMEENIVSCTSWNGGGKASTGYCCALFGFFDVVCFGLKSLVGLFFSHSNNVADWVGLSNIHHQKLPAHTKILLGYPWNYVFWSVIFLTRPLIKFFKPKRLIFK